MATQSKADLLPPQLENSANVPAVSNVPMSDAADSRSGRQCLLVWPEVPVRHPGLRPDKCAGAASKHFPKLHFAENGLGKNEVPDGRHIDPCVQHIHRDRDAGIVLVLEIVERLLGPLHLAINDLGQPLALKVRVGRGG